VCAVPGDGGRGEGRGGSDIASVRDPRLQAAAAAAAICFIIKWGQQQWRWKWGRQQERQQGGIKR